MNQAIKTADNERLQTSEDQLKRALPYSPVNPQQSVAKICEAKPNRVAGCD